MDEKFSNLVAQIKTHEGSKKVNGRHVAYKDHLGFLTIGYGTLIDEKRGGGISEAVANQLLIDELYRIQAELDRQIVWFRDLNVVRRDALTNMAYQMGVAGVLKFKNMLNSMYRGDFDKAYREALNSKWAKQTPNRAHEVAEMIRKG